MSESNPNKGKLNEGNEENIESNSSPSLPLSSSTEQQQSAFGQSSTVTPVTATTPTTPTTINPQSVGPSRSNGDENSELSELNTNLQANNSSLINSKTKVSINSKNNQSKGFRFRVEDLKLNKNIKSKSVKLNRIKQNLKSVKNTNLKRNQTLNIKQKSITPKAQRRSVSDLVDLMVHFNVNSTPKTISQPNASTNGINRRRNRTFTFQPNLAYSQLSHLRPSSTRQLPAENQQTTSISLGNRNETVDLRLLFILEKLINLIDRLINLINELRINYANNQDNDNLVNRIISQENNADLLNAISTTLPDRLANTISERFSAILAQELEKVFSKYFNDKKR